MTEERLPLAELLAKSGDADFLRAVAEAVLEEILEERVASSRGRQVPRGVKRKMSGYKLRPRRPQPTTRIDFSAAVRIVK